MTLRITLEAKSGSRAWRLRVDGILAAEGASLMEHECNRALESRGSVSLDLAGVHLVDRAAVESLRRLSAAGVEIVCRPGPVAVVLEGEGLHVTRDADDSGGR